MPLRPDTDRVAEELLAALDERRGLQPFASKTGLSLEDAYRIAARVRALRETRGERVIGRKIGFTNRNIWDEYRVYAPIWGYMYDKTVFDLARGQTGFELDETFEPKIEPEIAFHLAKAPAPDMDEGALIACVDWVAHGFEIVQSLFPGWSFSGADTVAAFGLHGGLYLGPSVPIGPDPQRWLEPLRSFRLELLCNGVLTERGCAQNVLEGPPSALGHLMKALERDTYNPPLSAGELITTGTLTRALSVSRAETWGTVIEGLPLAGLNVQFT